MKKNLMALAGLFAAGCMLFSCSSEVKEANYQIIPIPQEIVMGQNGAFTLANGTKVMYPEGNEKMQKNAQFLADYVKELTGNTLQVVAGTEGKGILLQVTPNEAQPEGYQLKVTPEGVVINGGSEAGVFYGIQTLRKSIPAGEGINVSLPAVEINDAPRFSYRGAMLDVSRHFFPVEDIKSFIDMIALHNINRFHWHLTDDQGWRIEIKCRPLLTEKASKRKETVIGRNSGKYDGTPHEGFYTQEQIKEIIAYAADQHITIIPEIDMPGHMQGALHAYPELGCTGGPYEVWTQWGVSDDVLCAGNDATLKFIEDVLGEVVELFPSEYIHVGGDECQKTRWHDCPKCQARIKALGIKGDKKHTAEEYLQSFIINHAEKFLNSKGRQMIGWDETLEGGLAPNATVMSWRGEGGGIEAAKQKHDVIMTPTTYLYFDYYQTKDIENEPLAIGGYLPLQNVYNYEPMTDKLTPEEQKYIIGVQANLWVEYIATLEHIQYMELPRMAALCEIQWSGAEKKNYDCFLSRLPQLTNLYDVKGYNYATHAFDITGRLVPNTAEEALEVTFKTIDNCPIYFTLNGSEPTAESPQYQGTFKVYKSCVIKAKGIRATGETRVFQEEIKLHKASFKPITMLQPINPGYKFEGEGVLLDGLKGNFNYKTGRWIAFYKNDLEAIIDMKEPTEISSVGISALVEKGDWVFGPRKFSVAISEDGKNFKEIAKEEYPEMTLANPNQIYDHTLTFDPVKTQYIKVYVQPEHKLPSWHGGKDLPAYIFVDEITVK